MAGVNKDSLFFYRLKIFLKARNHVILYKCLRVLKYFFKHLIFGCYQILGVASSIKGGKLILLADQRSGGTSLLRILAQHPKFTFIDEPLIDRVIHPAALLEGMATMAKIRGKAFGCKLKTVHILDKQGISSIEEFLMDMKRRGWVVVYLKRLNLAKQALSILYRRMCNKEHLKFGESKVIINKNEFLETYKKLERNIYNNTNLAEKLLCYSLFYESDVLNRSGSRQRKTDRLFGFLGLEPIATEHLNLKTDSEDLNTFLLNHVEIREFADEMGFILGDRELLENNENIKIEN